MNHQDYIEQICSESKAASRVIADLNTNERNNLLYTIAETLRDNSAEIIKENKKDLANAEKEGVSRAFYDRLLLSTERIDAMANSIKEIARFEDPIGGIVNMKTRPSGIRVGQMRVPLGVVAVIYESRPNVTTDIAALCIKSGNASILRGGKESIHSNTALYSVIKKGLNKAGVPEAVVTLITQTDRELVPILLKRDDYIDIVVPRGGEGLIKMVSRESTIPVIKHDKGLCTTFIDASAREEMANAIAVNAKVQRPGVCNALETLLIHKDYPHKESLLKALLAENVELRGCDKTVAVLPDQIKPAAEEDFDTEYLDLIAAVKIVDSMSDAINHIHTHSSGHSEAIVTEDYANSQNFTRIVDSAAVFVNASTRFHDGGEFGLGAEVGISTQKLHARGAMGVEGLTTLKFVILGQGEIR